MANRTNSSGNRQTGRSTDSGNKGNTARRGSSARKRKKNTSEDIIKFLLVLIVAGIAITLIIFSQTKKPVETGGTPTGVPSPSAAPTDIVAEITPGETQQPTITVTPNPEVTQPANPTVTTEPENSPTPTEPPVSGLSAEDAAAKIDQVVDRSVYTVQLLNDHLNIDGRDYYHFCISQNSKDLDPFLIVDKQDGTIHCYSFQGVLSDFVKFPLDEVSNQDPNEGGENQTAEGNITVEQAYNVLCTYPKERLGLAKNVSEYDAEYDSVLTLIKGSNCYRINLTEVSGGKVRNRGEYYISVDGTECFTIDNDLNDFVLITK